MTDSFNRNQGFTLIEAVVYIGLFSIAIGGTLVCAYQILENSGRNRIAVAAVEEGMFIRKKVEWALADADTASVSADRRTIAIVGPGSLATFHFDGRDITFARGVHDPLILNASSFPVEDLTFTYTPSGGGLPPSVKMEYRIRTMSYTLMRYLRE
ncbi:MAG: prepilin-type N-terminal cleavage/methylation domain-containing protein [Candidatus Pacebacteria bacterium]|nr:prepilin-type N-terminal cleavage/methylation domain-containing protein [Candidatus Paceibacterota bacterium]